MLDQTSQWQNLEELNQRGSKGVNLEPAFEPQSLPSLWKLSRAWSASISSEDSDIA